MSSAREETLRRIRAIDRGPAHPVERGYRRVGMLPAASRVQLFCDRTADYQAEVRRVDDVARAVAAICRDRGLARIGLPPGLPLAWRPAGIELVEDRGLSARELDELDGVVTGCTVAIAETGTLVLAGGPAEGRRALTLVPDLHVCVVGEQQVVELVPEALSVLGPVARRPLTFVSGPSATSDIELSRVEGVHGPRTLIVLVTSKEGA